MDPLPDLFPDFESLEIEGDGATIHLRKAGSGPPLLLLHGYPQTHAMWHRVAPPLSEIFTCIVPDLRGYGASSIPDTDPEHRAYSKRAMARDMVAVMKRLGHGRFAIAGHDRGGRVAYRMALDHPDVVTRIAVLDILPTATYWDGLDRKRGLKIYHWMFLAQPEPLPERLIGGAPDYYCDHTIASWTATRSLAAFDPAALAHYRAQMRDPARVHAMCEDYRAGAGPDVDDDAADRAAGRKIRAPLLAVWGAAGVAPGGGTPIPVWQDWAEDARGVEIGGGHFVAEETPDATLGALAIFFTED